MIGPDRLRAAADRLRQAADRLDREATQDRAGGEDLMAFQKGCSAAVYRAEADRLKRLRKIGPPAECRLDGCARSYLGHYCWYRRECARRGLMPL